MIDSGPQAVAALLLAGDTLSYDGEVDAIQLAALVRIVSLFEKSGWDALSMARWGFCSPMQTRQTLARHPMLRKALYPLRPLGPQVRGYVASLIHFFKYYLLYMNRPATQSKVRIEWFFDRLQDGSGLDKTHPIACYRKRLITDSNTKRTRKRPEELALLIKTWNAYVSDRTTACGWKPSEGFPVPLILKGESE